MSNLSDDVVLNILPLLDVKTIYNFLYYSRRYHLLIDRVTICELLKAKLTLPLKEYMSLPCMVSFCSRKFIPSTNVAVCGSYTAFLRDGKVYIGGESHTLSRLSNIVSIVPHKRQGSCGLSDGFAFLDNEGCVSYAAQTDVSRYGLIYGSISVKNVVQIATVMGEESSLFCLNRQGDVYVVDVLHSRKRIYSAVVSMYQEREGVITFTFADGSIGGHKLSTGCEYTELNPKVINIGKKKLTLYGNQLSIDKKVMVMNVREAYRVKRSGGLVAMVVTITGEIHNVIVDYYTDDVVIWAEGWFKFHPGEVKVGEAGWKVSVGWNANLLTC